MKQVLDHTPSDLKTIVTAGSGPSYSGWQHWPTWTKLLPLFYRCRVIDASAPAAGNRYLYRSVLTRCQDQLPDAVLVQWNLGKFDIYVDHQSFADEITTGTGIRNFLLDIHTGKTTKGPGYWCSSVDNTVPWKQYYNTKIKSQRGTALDDLEAMLGLQNFCAQKNVAYRFFTHDDVDHAYLSNDEHCRVFYKEIDWGKQVFPSVRRMYKSSEAYQYDISGKSTDYHWVPNADWQFWFVDEMLESLMTDFAIAKNQRLPRDKIKQICHDKTLEIYAKVSRSQ